MFNKTYQTRANRRGDLVSVQEILDQLVRKADADPRFYRPARKPDPRGTGRSRGNDRLQGVQLELFANPPLSQKSDIAPPPADETADQMFDRLFPET